MLEVGQKIEMKGVIGETFMATINGILTELPINVETKYGIIKAVIYHGNGKEYSYMIKYMCYEFPVEVDEDYILKYKHRSLCE